MPGSGVLPTPPVGKPADLAEVHLFTGVNGTGKTRLLSALAAMLGHPQPLLRRLKGSGRPGTMRATDEVPLRENMEEWRGEWQARPEGVDQRRTGAVTRWALQTPAFAYCGAAYVSDVPIRVIAGSPKPSRDFCLSFSRPEAQTLARQLANQISQRSMELAFVMGRELSQMDRQIAGHSSGR